MLILSRKKDEVVVIGGDIRIMIIDIRGDKVRLGIEAPADIPVHRKEIFDLIQEKEGKGGEEAAEEL